MKHDMAARARDDAPGASPFDGSALKGRVVLVCDDDPILAQTLQMVFTASGADEVLLAGDGVEARAQLAAHGDRIDALVLDLRMPNEDGVSFLRKAKELGYAGTLVLASGEQADVIKGAERLAHLYGLNCPGTLAKPFNPADLIHLLAGADRLAEPARPAKVPGDRTVVLDAVLYQPRVDVWTGQCVGAEALSRFVDGHGRDINPEAAIAHAESAGTIDALTWQIIDQVLADAVRMQTRLPAPMHLSINVSAETISKDGFVDMLCERVAITGLEPSDFTIELTETRLATDAMTALENLTRLRIKDIGVALDDFGTGHANVEQLGAYPFTELKIDKQFVIGAQTDRFAASCVEAAVKLAKSVGLKTVAEGIETQWAHDFVRNLEVDEAQGFLFSRPVALDRFLAYAAR